MTGLTKKQSQTTQLVHFAFRAAVVSLCRTLADSHQDVSRTVVLQRIPAATGCAPQVQLNLVLQAWENFFYGVKSLTVFDHCVLYCSLAELAEISAGSHEQLFETIISKPLSCTEANEKTHLSHQPVTIIDRLWLASKIRTMLITWPFPSDSAEFLRESGLLSDELDTVGDPSSPIAAILDALANWKVHFQQPAQIRELLTEPEIQQLDDLMRPYAVMPA